MCTVFLTNYFINIDYFFNAKIIRNTYKNHKKPKLVWTWALCLVWTGAYTRPILCYRYEFRKDLCRNKYTIDQILPTLQEMDFVKYEGKGYQPVYTRTELTDDLHEAFGFCTSKQIVPIQKMKNICSTTKK